MKIPKCTPNVLTGLRIVLTFIYLLLLDNLNFYSNNRLYFASAGIVFFFNMCNRFYRWKNCKKNKGGISFRKFFRCNCRFYFYHIFTSSFKS